MQPPNLKLYYDMGGCACGGGNGRFRRLYFRMGSRGRQKFEPWGFQCKNCMFIFPDNGDPMRFIKEQVKWYQQAVKHKKLIQPEIVEMLEGCPQNTSKAN